MNFHYKVSDLSTLEKGVTSSLDKSSIQDANYPVAAGVYPVADYADAAENTHHNQLIASNINRGAVADSEYLHNLRRMSYSKLYYHIVFVVKKRLILSGLQPLCG